VKKNIFAKTILLIAVFSLITSLYLIIYLRNSYTEEKIKELKNYNSFIEKTINKSENSDINSLMKGYENNTIRITIIKESGEVIFDSEEDSSSMANHSNRDEVIAALREGEGISSRFSNTLKKEMLYYSKYYEKNQEIYIIRTAIPISSIYGFTKDILQNYIYIFLLGIGLTILTAYSIYNKIDNNYKKISKAVSRINNGFYGEKLIINDEEFRELINNFNGMSEKINKKIETLEFENNSLNAIFRSMKDGVLVIDDDKRIIYNNPVVRNLFNIGDNIREKKISDIIRNYELNRIVL
jgi:two-component system phosphate regulon sensor histidine kinase PhoR